MIGSGRVLVRPPDGRFRFRVAPSQGRRGDADVVVKLYIRLTSHGFRRLTAMSWSDRIGNNNSGNQPYDLDV